MMTIRTVCAVVVFVALCAGCDSQFVGNYTASARLMEGTEESTEPGYSLAEILEKLAAAPRSLELKSDGRFVWNTGDSVNQGTWRMENDTLILRDDMYNDTRIQPSLQSDRKWRITPQGEFVTNTYTAYNVEEVYAKR